ncbi:MAG: hypothetical protein KFKLKKLM_00336 [Flavobacteriales bacterium]|nr:hypothetical protein [Flavobacteriales bacterium]
MIKKIETIFIVVLCNLILIGCSNNIDCNNTIDGYKSGYEIGMQGRWITPEEYIRNCNNGNGMLGNVPPCWKEGYRDAIKELDKKF